MSWLARSAVYAVAGAGVGFLILGELGWASSIPVLAILLALAVVSLVAALRGNQTLSAWAPFLFAAMIMPLLIGIQTVGLPLCVEARAGTPCFAGSRDYHTPFWLELAIFAIATVASVLSLRFAL